MTEPFPPPRLRVAENFVARERGFDRDNDDELIGIYEGVLAEGTDIRDGDHYFLGLLYYRQDRHDDAIAVLAQERSSVFKATYLKAVVHLDAGSPDAALVALDELLEREQTHERMGRAGLLATAGQAHLDNGDLDLAKQAFSESLHVEESIDNLVGLARVAWRKGSHDAAVRFMEHAVELDDLDGDLQRARASLLAARGQVDDTVALLEEAALGYEPDALQDLPESLREHPTVRSWLDRPEPDYSWLDDLPAWVRALRGEDGIEALGFSWLGREEAQSEVEHLQDTFQGETYASGTLWYPQMWADCGQRVHDIQVLARGPEVADSGAIRYTPLLVLADGQLHVALDRQMPPTLWIETGTTLDTLRPVVEHYLPLQRTAHHAFPRVVRAFAGAIRQLRVPNPYSGQLEAAFPHELDRHWVMSPYVDNTCWGSSQLDDPWPDRIPPQPGHMMKVNAWQKRVRQQAPGGVCTFTRRTLFSRSHLAMEIHHADFYVWECRYRPAPHAAVIERVNELLDQDFPTDMPMDLVGALIGFVFMEEDALREGLDGDDVNPTQLDALFAVLIHDLHGTDALARQFWDHPAVDIRGTVFNNALAKNLQYLFGEWLEHEAADSPLHPHLREAMLVGCPKPQYDEHGEPPGLYQEA